MFSRIDCCIGEDVRINFRWVKAHGHVSPWSPAGSAPKTARASDARIWNQTIRIGASDPKNDAACNGRYRHDPTCCAASRQPISGVDCRSKMGAKSKSMEKADFFNLISGLFCFCFFDGIAKKPESFLITDDLLVNDLSKIWIKPELDQIAGARSFVNGSWSDVSKPDMKFNGNDILKQMVLFILSYLWYRTRYRTQYWIASIRDNCGRKAEMNIRIWHVFSRLVAHFDAFMQ